jgi:ubiquinone/menaquinone biosynthesis C-methylase UbiE
MQHPAPPQAEIFHVVGGYWLSRAVYLAARLKLADAVGDRPASLSEIARTTGTRPENLRRLMRALAAHGFFRDTGNENFGQTPLSETLRSDRPGSMRAFAEAELGHDHYDSWANAESCLREGGTAFERLYGMPIWRYYAEHPETNALFGEAMTNLTAIANAAVLSSYQFAPFRHAVDIGGGHGSFLSAILDHHPDARAVLFDLPSVLAAAARAGFVTRHQARLELAGGDFFEAVPAGGDLYLLKFVLHDWDDERSGAILNNIRRVIDPTGRLVVVEIVLPPMNEPHIGPLIDLNMMVMTGGAERTEFEYGELLAKSGFRMERVAATRSPFSVIEAAPA